MRATLLLVLLAACDNFGDLEVLDHPQILAVRAEPPALAAGERARIDVLAGAGDGSVSLRAPDRVESVVPGVIEETAEGWFVIAPATLPAELVALPIAVTVTIDGQTRVADKVVRLGAAAANPEIAAMWVDGNEIDASGMTVRSGTEPVLGAACTGTQPLAYAGYSSVGKLEHHRSPEATLLAETPAMGTLLLVLRDEVGGVTWRITPARVD